MKFLIPVGGVTDHRFGILTNYNHNGIPIGIKNGMEWGGDVPVFGKKHFDPVKWRAWLNDIEPYRDTCLFLSCPDVPFCAEKTHNWWNIYRSDMDGWPVAFVAQDGQEELEFPDPSTWHTLFIGGSTKWKESQAAIDCIKAAIELGKNIHIGRVNWGKRYRMFEVLSNSDKFTCDGTRTRYDGTKVTLEAWGGYMAQSPLFRL